MIIFTKSKRGLLDPVGEIIVFLRVQTAKICLQKSVISFLKTIWIKLISILEEVNYLTAGTVRHHYLWAAGYDYVTRIIYSKTRHDPLQYVSTVKNFCSDRYFPIDVKYNVTPSKKSQVRQTDELWVIIISVDLACI